MRSRDPDPTPGERCRRMAGRTARTPCCCSRSAPTRWRSWSGTSSADPSSRRSEQPMTLLDELVYPWPDPLAQELHRTLIALQPSGPPVLLLAKQAGVDTSWISEQQPVALLWKDVLEHAAKANRLPTLIHQVLDLLGPDHPARPFLQQVLNGARPPISAEPRAADATPSFLHADDSVSGLEAMLFGDDLTIPIGHVPGLIAALNNLLVIGPSVCKLTVGLGGAEQYGTAFRIGPDLLLT